MKKTLLAVLAHPDDESFGPGGTFARYSAENVAVHIAIATDGAAGSVAEGHESARENLVAVRAGELDTAINVLGATLHRLDYRDSGMTGDPANEHPDAFINSDDYEAIGRIVRLIRECKPQVVITHDETGNYFHPDHIRCWEITTAAFYAASDPDHYPELGLPTHQPDRLYYTAFSNRMVKFLTIILRLRRQDPTAWGRNKDINLTKLGYPAEKMHARINYRAYWEQKVAASVAHASQGGGSSRFRWMPNWMQKRLIATDTYIRAYPLVPDGFRETDLFP